MKTPRNSEAGCQKRAPTKLSALLADAMLLPARIWPSSDAVLRNTVHRLIALAIYLLLIALLLLVAPPARANGGAHVIDSASLETSGVCHLAPRAARYGPGRDLLDVSPARTPLPMLKVGIGGAIQHVLGEGNDGGNAQAIALALTIGC